MNSPAVNKLMDCAIAVAECDLKSAALLLDQIEVLTAAETSRATKKVVEWFAEALARRIHGVHTKYAQPLLPSANIEDYYNYEFYPFEHIANVSTKYAIQYLCFSGEKRRLHFIDFSVREDPWGWHYWIRQVGLSSLQLTSIGFSLSRNNQLLQEVHRRLAKKAQQLCVDFELERFEANSVSDIVNLVLQLERKSQDEILIVRWAFELHKLLAEEGAVEKVLSKLKDLNPDLMVIVEQEANHNIPDFFQRFTQSFQYYFSIYKSLLERSRYLTVEEKQTWRWEMHLRRQISNVIARDGVDRVERHETLACWQERLQRAGFRSVQLVLNYYLQLADFFEGCGYKLKEENGFPMLWINDRPLIFISFWTPAHQFHDGIYFNFPITIQDTSSSSSELESDQVEISSESDHEEKECDFNTTGHRKIWSSEEVREYLVTCFTERELKRIKRYICCQMTGNFAPRDKILDVCETSLASLLRIPPPTIPIEEEKQYYVDDTVINAFFKLLWERSEKFPQLYVKNYWLPTWMMVKRLYLIKNSCFLLSGHWCETKVLSCLNIEAMVGTSQLFIPVCLGNHWILLCVDMEKRVLLWLDSLNSSPNAYLTEMAVLAKWIAERLMPQLGYHDVNEWPFCSKMANIPYQTNRVDCGIFVMKYADCLVHRGGGIDGCDHFPFTQQDMPHFRLRVFLDIYRGKLPVTVNRVTEEVPSNLNHHHFRAIYV